MKKYLLISIGLLALVLLFSGCDEPAKKVTFHSPADFLDELYTPAVDCGFGSLVKPTNLTPGGEGVVTDANATLSWDFSGCDVSSFTINLVDSHSFQVENIVNMNVSEYARSLVFTNDYLDDCTTYYWLVRAWGYTEYKSDVASFHTNFTGSCPPVQACTGAPPQPIAYAPSSGFISIPNPQLLWIDSQIGCKAQAYHYEVSLSPDFSDLVLEGGTTAHSYSQATGYLDMDCTNYFWRVTAIANGITRTSNVMQFGTQFTEMCGHMLCEMDQINEMTKPTLILPADGSAITDPTPQFLWDDNLDYCWPGHFELEVSEDLDFSNSLWQSVGGSQLSWTPTAYDIFSNCMKYYWKVTAYPSEGDGYVESDIGTFYTNFGNTICALEWQGEIPVEMVRDWGLGCVSSNQMWAIYDFKGPVFGRFEVQLDGHTWPCELMEGTNNRLMCFGPLAPQQVESEVRLFLVGGEEPVLTLEGLTPQCVGVAICQPPAEGCPPIRNSRTGEVLANTHWDAGQCACVP